MYKHVVPLYLIGAPSPADVDRLVLELIEVQARRAGQPIPGEPLLRDAAITCSAVPGNDDECRHFEIAASAGCPGAGQVRCRFQVELHLAEEGQLSAEDAGTAELVKEMARPATRDALGHVAHRLTASATVRPTSPARPGLLGRLRRWAVRRAMVSAQAGDR